MGAPESGKSEACHSLNILLQNDGIADASSGRGASKETISHSSKLDDSLEVPIRLGDSPFPEIFTWAANEIPT